VRDITVEGIAREAGVGKVTIYRWCPNKTRVIIDAFMELMTPKTSMPRPGAEFSDLTQHFREVVREYQGKFGRIVAEIVAEGQFDRDAFDYFLDAMMAKRRAFAVNVVEQSQRSGQIRDDISPDILIDLLYGPIYFRLLVGHQPLDRAFASDVVKFVTELATRTTDEIGEANSTHKRSAVRHGTPRPSRRTPSIRPTETRQAKNARVKRSRDNT